MAKFEMGKSDHSQVAVALLGVLFIFSFSINYIQTVILPLIFTSNIFINLSTSFSAVMAREQAYTHFCLGYSTSFLIRLSFLNSGKQTAICGNSVLQKLQIIQHNLLQKVMKNPKKNKNFTINGKIFNI